jgi:hypothetical protein
MQNYLVSESRNMEGKANPMDYFVNGGKASRK